MGIVQRQSFKNTITTYLGFGIGAINVLFLFTYFLTDEYHGLVVFVLSTANIMMPLFTLGTHNTIIKFYSSFKRRNNLNSFLTLMLLFPLLLIIPVGLIGVWVYEWLSTLISTQNPMIKDYVWLIYIAAICFAYFEIFYSWAKVQLQSVFGNFMKEVFHRVGVMVLFLLIYIDLISVPNFIYGVIIVYVVRLFVMMIYAFGIRKPVFRISKFPNMSSVIKYSLLIIIAGSVATVLLEIDKFMLGEYVEIEKVAYYGVAIYIASVIGVPSRSMHQITNPITAQLLNDKNKVGLEDLYKKSSLNLFIISGLIFLLIILNINSLYQLIPVEYSIALLVVFLVSIAKLGDNLIGNNNAILFNSDYYRVILIFGLLLAVITIVLNMLLIPIYGINGAAFATVISISLYNAAKLWFVYYKFGISPFSIGTVKTLMLILVMLAVFYFWEFGFHPILNIALKSALIGLIYGSVVYVMDFSNDITFLIDKYIRRL